MLKNLKYSVIIITTLISLVFLPSCSDFLDPDQDLNVTKDKLFDDTYEYRSVAMGMYALQQKLVEQLVVLGELRGDLLTVTPNADADLIEINNFQVSKTNKYADPTNFYKLISACNSFITELKLKHPEVLDKKIAVTNYDRLFGEALTMRAWAYFNAARIYGKIPVIHESLTSVEEIETYLNSSSTYIDSVSVVFKMDGDKPSDGYKNDTIYNKAIVLEKQYYDLDMVMRVFTKQLEKEIKIVDGVPAVGVNNYMDLNDNSWEVTIWNQWAWHALLGQMYLTAGDFAQSNRHLHEIAYITSNDYRYQLDRSFSLGSWKNIFTGIDIKEHIYTVWFNKANQQQNNFQNLFEPYAPHQYMLKPTKTAVHMWEGSWKYFNLIINSNPALTELDELNPGYPSDLNVYSSALEFVRGYGVSYSYIKDGLPLSSSRVFSMLMVKQQNDMRTVTSIMDGVDTIVNKYSINKSVYDEDANFTIFRAGGIQLYLAEIYTWWSYAHDGLVSPFTTNAVNIVTNGSNYNAQSNRLQLGVQGRAGMILTQYDGIQISNIIYLRDPFTNKVIGYKDFTVGSFTEKQKYLEEQILDERARELAFEGERFYDLMRVAKRRNDPSFLANRVSAKYPAGQREAIKAKLMDEKNWYINIFD